MGFSGVGKSSMVNRLLGKKDTDDDAAMVGSIGETTLKHKAYDFEMEDDAGAKVTLGKFWDVPGGGTDKFKQEEYIRKMGLRYFDALVLLTDGRWTQVDADLYKAARSHKIPVLVVRTKMDQTIQNSLESMGTNPAATMKEARDSLEKNLYGNNFDHLAQKKARLNLEIDELQRQVNANYSRFQTTGEQKQRYQDLDMKKKSLAEAEEEQRQASTVSDDPESPKRIFFVTARLGKYSEVLEGEYEKLVSKIVEDVAEARGITLSPLAATRSPVEKEEERVVEEEGWWDAYRHTATVAMRNAVLSGAKTVYVIGIRSDADKGEATAKEWPAMMTEFRKTYQERKEPFFKNGGKEQQLDWDDIEEVRTSISRLANKLKACSSIEDQGRAIIISCNEHEMDQAVQICNAHNQSREYNDVVMAWATKNDVYGTVEPASGLVSRKGTSHVNFARQVSGWRC